MEPQESFQAMVKLAKRVCVDPGPHQIQRTIWRVKCSVWPNGCAPLAMPSCFKW